MAKPATILVKLESTANTGYYYVTKKNPRTQTEKLEFRKPIALGSILQFRVERARIGTTSVTYDVHVFRDDTQHGGEEEAVFATSVTFVRVDESGHKCALPAPRG